MKSQILFPLGDALHEISNPIYFWEKNKKNI